MVFSTGGKRRKYGGSTTGHGFRKGDLVSSPKGIGYVSGDTEKQLFKGRHLERDGKEVSGIICTANEGPVRVQYKCLVPIYVFPEM